MMGTKLVLLLWMVTISEHLAMITSDPIGDNVFSEENCHQNGMLVLYRIKLVTRWSKKLFPKHYPEFRPPPHWSMTLGLTHNQTYQLFQLKHTASMAVATFAETGQVALLEETLEVQQDFLFDEFRLPKIRKGKGESEATFFVNGKHSSVSFITKIIPSPDWFIGLDTFDLCFKGRWLEKVTIPLHPLDAGSSSGLTFTSPKWPTNPRGVVEQITSRSPLHFASSFFYPEIKHLPPIAHVTFTKIKEYNNHNNVHKMVKKLKYKHRTKLLKKLKYQSNVGNTENMNHTNKTLNDTDCRVSEWSAWSPCSKTCGLGKRNRTRNIIREQRLGGVECPMLVETQWCGSARQCSVFDSYFKW